MGRKLLLANLVILAGIVVLAQQLVASWQEFQGVPVIAPLPSRSPELEPPAPPERASPLSQFLIIAEKNLFTQGRGNEPDDADAEAERPPDLPVKPKLVSVSSFAGTREAVLEIFEGRRGQNSQRQVVREGADVQGYEVASIDDTSLTLTWKQVSHVIDLEPYRAQPRQAARASSGVTVITVGAAAAAVETTSPTAEEEEGRGLEVGVVSAQQGRGGAQAGAGRGALGGRGQTGRGTLGRGQAGRGNLGRGNLGRTQQQGLPGTVGLGQQQRPQQPPPR